MQLVRVLWLARVLGPVIGGALSGEFGMAIYILVSRNRERLDTDVNVPVSGLLFAVSQRTYAPAG